MKRLVKTCVSIVVNIIYSLSSSAHAYSRVVCLHKLWFAFCTSSLDK